MVYSDEKLVEFLEDRELSNLVHFPTCFMSEANPSTIDLIITNKPKSFQNTTGVSTGISDFHKMVLTYTPRLVLSWYDERLEHCDHSPRSINRKQISRLWTPRIAVENHLERITGYLDARKLSIPSCSVSCLKPQQ